MPIGSSEKRFSSRIINSYKFHRFMTSTIMTIHLTSSNSSTVHLQWNSWRVWAILSRSFLLFRSEDTTPCLDRFEAVVDDMKKRGQTAIYSSIVEATKMLQWLEIDIASIGSIPSGSSRIAQKFHGKKRESRSRQREQNRSHGWEMVWICLNLNDIRKAPKVAGSEP